MDDNRLDLRYNGNLNTELCQLFTKLSYDLREKYNEFVTELSKPNKDNLDWWVQSPASRNTFSSSLFHYYCCLHLIRYLIDSGGINYRFIVIDSRVMKSYIDKMLADGGIKDCKVLCDHTGLKYVKYVVRINLVLVALFFKKIIQLLISRKIDRSPSIRSKLKNKPVVLIDTFMLAGYTAQDRWYGELWNSMTDEQKAETYFVPTIVMTSLRSMESTYLDLRSSERNFLVKEDYLNIKDIIHAFAYRVRARKITIRSLKILGIDVSNLVWEEIRRSRDVSTVVESILIYRFVKHISKSGINVRLAIDWFEGQATDKAWNLAFRRYYPKSKRIGYRALEGLPFYLCSYPIQIEREAGVIPDTMGVQSRASAESVGEFLLDLNVVVVPSFRSTHVWEESKRNKEKNGKYTVLVTLPISIHTSIRIIKELIEINKVTEVDIHSIHYVIKPHPTVTVESLRKILSFDLPESFIVSEEKSFPKLLRKSDLLITEASNTCLEAMACGLPVIIIENTVGLTNDPVPKNITYPICNRVDSSAELLKAIRNHINSGTEDRERIKEYSLAVRNHFFEPITEPGLNKFLDIHAKETTIC